MTFKEVRLQDILDIRWGDTKTTKAAYVPTGYVAYSAAGPDGFLEKFDYDRDGVVLSAIGNCGSTFYAMGKWSCIKNTIRIFPKTADIDLKYFYYMTKAPNFWPLRGSAQPFISQTDVRETFVRVPAVAIQKVIGQILHELEMMIEANKKISQTLEDIAQTIFKSWFIDFDPVKAKMAGEKPFGMDAATAVLFPESMEDSELGLIPKGWVVGRLGDVFGLQGGYAFKSSSWAESGVPVVKIGSVKPGFVDLNQVSYVAEELADTIPAAYKLEPGSLVVGLTGYVGQVGLVRTHKPHPLLNQRVARFIGVDGRWRIPFTYCLTRRSEFKKAVEAAANGSAQQNVSNSQILAISTVLPPQPLMNYFESVFESSFRQSIALADENENLAQLRDALLPRLISGELQIPEEMLVS